MPSSSKNSAERKFNVIYLKEKQKTLRLECSSCPVRNTWYEALKKTIFAAKEASSKAWSKSDSIVNMKYKEYLDDFSDDESKDVEDSSRAEPSEDLEDTYNKRYAVTSNFLTQQFGDIDPMADNISQSEQDLGSPRKERKYMLEQNYSTSAQLSPFERSKKNKFWTGKDGSLVTIHSNSNNTRYHGKDSVKQIASKQQNQRSLKDRSEFTKKRSKSNIIRKSRGDSCPNEVEPSRLLTLRLDNF